MIVKDWSKYPNFTAKEFNCKETGENEMQDYFLETLQKIRAVYGKPMPVNSGFRSKKHSIEAAKGQPGEHSYGCAADIACNGPDALLLVSIALKMGINRIGVSQRAGVGRYVHLGMGDLFNKFPVSIWSY